MSDIYVNRLKKELSEVVQQTQPLYFLIVLHAWYETGHESDVINGINDLSSDDDGFMNLLSKMTSWRESSDKGVEYTINPKTLDKYFPAIPVVERLESIMSNDSRTSEMKKTASELIEKINRGKE